MNRNGIPTTYHNYKFRSRLEATWACFFDHLGWKWKYEPFDYNGYIPDFVLLFPHAPILVEVKPCLSFQEMREHTRKIDMSPWNGEAIILGVGINTDSAETRIGLIGGFDFGKDNRVWDKAVLTEHVCHPENHRGVQGDDGGWWCRFCGVHEYSYLAHEIAEKWWAQSQNMVQWAPKMFGIADAVR